MNRTATIHKRWTAVIIAVLAVLLCAVVFSFSGCNQGETTAAGEPMVTTIHNTEHMQLTSAATAADGDDSNSVVLTAVIAPDFAVEAGVSWEMSFADPSSAWAAGKSVSDYVLLVPEADNTLKATLTCTQAFGEKIIVKATSNYNPTYFAVCMLDFERKADDVKFTLYYDGAELDSVLYSEMLSDSVESEYFQFDLSSNVNSDGMPSGMTVFADFTDETKTYEIKVEVLRGESYTIDKSFHIQQYDYTDKYGEHFVNIGLDVTQDDFFVLDAYVSSAFTEEEAAFLSKLETWVSKSDQTGMLADLEQYNGVYYKFPLSLESTPQGDLVLESPFGDWRDDASELITMLALYENNDAEITEEYQQQIIDRFNTISSGFSYMGEVINFDETVTGVADYFYDRTVRSERLRFGGIFGVQYWNFSIAFKFNTDSLPLNSVNIVMDQISVTF